MILQNGLFVNQESAVSIMCTYPVFRIVDKLATWPVQPQVLVRNVVVIATTKYPPMRKDRTVSSYHLLQARVPRPLPYAVV